MQTDHSLRVLRALRGLFIWLLLCSTITAQDIPKNYPEEPKVAGASDEGERAIKSFVYPKGLKINLFAAEPDVANPVAIHVDFQGQVFVCESFRQGKGIEDNRNHGNWLDDDLAAQSVADRVAYIKKFLGKKAIEYARYDDRIRLLKDKDGDGKADSSQVFANRFNQIEMGTGAGVLSYRDKVYYTCIPDLWLIEDKDRDGVSNSRRSLQTGYGVRFAFRGHDSHGLIVGPDGRLYFSIGDRGYNIQTEGKTFKDPSSGAVFRCDLDGSNFEVIATGLRNPQELAFDEFGNLFTGDNNSDSGDKARWVYIVPGSDSGWRMYYQYLPDRGPFNREKIWHTYSAKDSPAYIVPPVTNLADGPSGLAYYPGTGLGDQFKGRFFLCDFRGGPSNSGIRTFKVQPKGAFFEVTNMEQTFWRQLVTDLHFAPDGSLYVSDWVNGWEGLGKGRIYRYTNPENQKSMLVAEVQKLLGQGMSNLEAARLVELLDSPDQRVRQEAQFELVVREDRKSLASVALDESRKTLPRIHAIWGLEQLTRHSRDKSTVSLFEKLLDASDDEVRAQAAKMIGDCGATGIAQKLAPLLKDENARVRFFASLSLSKQKPTAEFDAKRVGKAVFQLLDENADEDPIVRHGGIMALAGLDSNDIWKAALDSNSRFVQKAAVVAIRKLKDRNRQIELLESYVSNGRIQNLDSEVLIEVVRTIHDLPLIKLFPEIAVLAKQTQLADPILRRAMNAAFRMGTADDAALLTELAADRDASELMRLEALALLKTWAKPSNRDRVLGDWRPFQPRSAEPASSAVRKRLASILAGTTKITRSAIDTATRLGIKEIEPTLYELFTDESSEAQIRADALRALESTGHRIIEKLASLATQDSAVEVRIAGRDVLSRVKPSAAVLKLDRAIQSDSMVERQAALATLSRMNRQNASPVINKAMDRLIKGSLPSDTRLDALMAARALGSSSLLAQVKEYENAKPKNDPLAPFAECKEGGNKLNGERIFFEKASVYCMRCHKVNGRGGEVGPELSKIGKEKDRRYLLEAIVNPNGAIAKNFETVLVATDDGLTYSGILKSETDEELVLVSPEGKNIRIDKETIEQRGTGKSSMPADLIKDLSLAEIRDLVEYLSSLK